MTQHDQVIVYAFSPYQLSKNHKVLISYYARKSSFLYHKNTLLVDFYVAYALN